MGAGEGPGLVRRAAAAFLHKEIAERGSRRAQQFLTACGNAEYFTSLVRLEANKLSNQKTSPVMRQRLITSEWHVGVPRLRCALL